MIVAEVESMLDIDQTTNMIVVLMVYLRGYNTKRLTHY